jgi:hypothetical protein
MGILESPCVSIEGTNIKIVVEWCCKHHGRVGVVGFSDDNSLCIDIRCAIGTIPWLVRNDLPEWTQFPDLVTLLEFIAPCPIVKGRFSIKLSAMTEIKRGREECKESVEIEIRPVCTKVDECILDVG